MFARPLPLNEFITWSQAQLNVVTGPGASFPAGQSA